ncbi:deoxyuridine 5'-triphosphate nucleotidohydrolase [candidate division SR1 bacterium]|nr:deoxyuridine 5'-triphosphate nucleotidohydrolase [candidate division SR1 bacterium]
MYNIIICSYDAALIPTQGSAGAVCWDLCCSEDFSVNAGQITMVGSGVKTYLPEGRGARIYARSSLPTKMGLMLANGVAVIDSDYRGEYRLQFYNRTNEIVQIKKGTRLAQIEFFQYGRQKERLEPEILVDSEIYKVFAEKFPTDRGEGGIGSTGL